MNFHFGRDEFFGGEWRHLKPEIFFLLGDSLCLMQGLFFLCELNELEKKKM